VRIISPKILFLAAAALYRLRTFEHRIHAGSARKRRWLRLGVGPPFWEPG
jgi:hypothetical protein